MISNINLLISKLNDSQLLKVSHYITELLSSENYNYSTITSCPYCGSKHFHKYGFDSKNNQRYKCVCGKTFTNSSNSFFYHSKISKDIWKNFIDLEISGITLKELSYYLSLNIHTCFNMRHKLYSACSIYLDNNTRFKGLTEIDSSYTKINLKGTMPYKMPRISKKRGNTSAFSGISRHKLCVLVSEDENDNCYMKISGLGPETVEKYDKFSHLYNNSKLLVSDNKSCIKQFANHIGKDIDQIKPKVLMNMNYVPEKFKNHLTKNGNHIQDVNELAKNIKDIIRIYHGVSTRYLNQYLAFCCLRKMILYKYERVNTVKEMINLIQYNYIKIKKPIMPVDLKEAYWDYNYGIFKH